MKLSSGTTFKASALLFDMDGTLVNSKAAVVIAWRRFAEKHHLDLQTILDVSHGRRTEEIVAHFLPETDVAKEVAIVTKDEIDLIDGVIEIDGAKQLLTSLPRDRWAVVTSAELALFKSRMKAANLPLPDVIITAEDVNIGKPNPEGYLKAAAALGFKPQDCIVFEDAPAGIKAGESSGARVIALATELDESALKEHDYILDYKSIELVNVDPKEGMTFVIK